MSQLLLPGFYLYFSSSARHHCRFQFKTRCILVVTAIHTLERQQSEIFGGKTFNEFNKDRNDRKRKRLERLTRKQAVQANYLLTNIEFGFKQRLTET